MNKKILTAFIACAMLSSLTSAMAADSNNVTVTVNGAVVDYEDQNAVISNDRTLVPVRGAFEAMNAKVSWDSDTQTVTINSADGINRAVLTIGDTNMQTYKFQSVFKADRTDVTLDTAPVIMNDRTMLPLRAIGEALGAEVAWDADTYTASITTADMTKTPDSEKLAVALSQGTSENADEVTVNVDLKNIAAYTGTYVGGVTIGINYDKTALTPIDAKLYNGDTLITNGMDVLNPDFTDSRLKAVAITIDEENAAKTDVSVMKLTFKKLTDTPTEVSISTAYHSRLGYDTSILLTNDASTSYEVDGTDLAIDSAPLTIQ